jgi:hypothetical protein
MADLSEMESQPHLTSQSVPEPLSITPQDQFSNEQTDASPLSDLHIQMLGSSVKSAKPVRKAAGYARVSGWMTLMAGVVSVLFSLGSISGMMLGIILAAVGMRELGLARRLDALDLRAPAGLAINQLVLGAALIGYAAFKMVTFDAANGVLAGSLGSDPTIASMPEMAGTLDELGRLEYLLNVGVSGVLIVVAFVMQGGTALYYWRKKKRVQTLHRHTPGWVLRVHEVMSNPKSGDQTRRAA